MLQNKYDLQMQQGATFQLQLYVTDSNTNPIDLSTYSSNLEIRKCYGSNTVVESLSTANSEIVLGTNTGIYELTLPASRTANINVCLSDNIPPNTRYVYDMNLQTNTGIVTKIIWGFVDVYGQVSR